MIGESTVARAYRRLLLAYPRRYRRERGAEIVSTLLDAACPGQVRPTRREAIDLVFGGLRCRFAVPPGPLYRVAAILAALVFGLGTSALAAWWSWTRSAPPTAATGMAVGREITPRGPSIPPDVSSDDPLLWTVYVQPWDGPSPFRGEAGGGYVHLSYDIAAAEVDTALSTARDRLSRHGWRVGDPVVAVEQTTMSRYTMFWAERGHLAVRVHVVPDHRRFFAQVHRTQPGGVSAAAAAGLVAGIAGGWLLAARVLRRFRAHGARTRAVLTVLGAPSLLVGAVLATDIAVDTVRGLVDGTGWSSRLAVYPAALLVNAMPLPFLVLLGLVGTAAMAARRTEAGPVPTREIQRTYLWRYSARTVTGVHLMFAACWVAVLVVYLSAVGPDREGMLQGRHDPKDIFAFPTVVPWMVTYLLSLIGSVVSPALLALSVPLLVGGRRRSERATKALLAIGVLTAMLLPFTWFLPLQHDLTRWLLD